MKPSDYLFGQNWIDQAQRALRQAHWPAIDGCHGFSALHISGEIITEAIEWSQTLEGNNVWAARHSDMWDLFANPLSEL